MIDARIRANRVDLGMLSKMTWTWHPVDDKDIVTRSKVSYSDMVDNQLYWRDDTYYVKSRGILYKILGSEYDIWRLGQYMRLGLTLKNAIAKINK